MEMVVGLVSEVIRGLLGAGVGVGVSGGYCADATLSWNGKGKM